MDLEDKVDVLRTHLARLSSEQLRMLIIEQEGDVKKALAASQAGEMRLI